MLTWINAAVLSAHTVRSNECYCLNTVFTQNIKKHKISLHGTLVGLSKYVSTLYQIRIFLTNPVTPRFDSLHVNYCQFENADTIVSLDPIYNCYIVPVQINFSSVFIYIATNHNNGHFKHPLDCWVKSLTYWIKNNQWTTEGKHWKKPLAKPSSSAVTSYR